MAVGREYPGDLALPLHVEPKKANSPLRAEFNCKRLELLVKKNKFNIKGLRKHNLNKLLTKTHSMKDLK